MRFLFISYAFPGPFAPLCSWLSRKAGNSVVFASSIAMVENTLPHIQRIIMKKFKCARNGNPCYQDMWEDAIRSAKNAKACYATLKDSGFMPDIIFNSSSNGIDLCIADIFPQAFRVNFLEREHGRNEARKKCGLAIQFAQTLDADLTFAFAPLAPEGALPLQAAIAPRFVDTDFFAPQGRHARNMVSIICENNENHCWCLCQRILALAPDCRINLVLDNSFALRQLDGLAARAGDTGRLNMIARPDQEKLRRILADSALVLIPAGHAHILEAMSAGATVMAPRAGLVPLLAKEVIDLGASSPDGQAAEIIAALDAGDLLKKFAASARKCVTANFAMAREIPAFMETILASYGRRRQCA